MTGNWTVIEAAPVASLRCGGRISLPKEPDISFRLIAACFLSWGGFLNHVWNTIKTYPWIMDKCIRQNWPDYEEVRMIRTWPSAPLLCSPSLLCLLPDLRLCIINIGGKLAKVLEIENWRPIFISLLAPWARVIQLSLLLLELETKVNRRISQSQRRPH